MAIVSGWAADIEEKTMTIKRKLKSKVRAMLKAKTAGKAYYQRADELLVEVLTLAPVGTVIDIGNGEQAVIVNNFAKGNKAWGHGSVNQFDVKVETAPVAVTL